MQTPMPFQKLINFYAYLMIIGVIYGFIEAHTYIFGFPWSTCNECSSKFLCNSMFHLVVAPLSLFDLYVAWFGLKRYTLKTQPFFITLLDNAFTVNLVLFGFETMLILTQLYAKAPFWEIGFLFSAATLLLVGAGFSFFIKQKIMLSQS